MITQAVTNTVRLVALALAMSGLVACGSQPAATSTSPQSRPSVTSPNASGHVPSPYDRAATIALQQVGVPYRYGGSSTSGFDCSGLVQYSYTNAGLRAPRTTGQLWSAARTITRQNLRRGDLVFFNIDGKMAHVGLYVGQGRFVHAPSSGRSVTVARLDSPFYAKAFARAGRLH